MEKTPFIWMDGKLIPWDEAKIHVLIHGLHYGSAIFEGVRFYETDAGPAIFRLQDHTKRFLYSGSTIAMEISFSEKEINEATISVVAKSGVNSGYIRPLAFYGYGKMGLNPVGAPVNVVIACWPWGKYLPDRPLKAKISEYMRIHPKSLIADAKVSGHYVNSILASLEVRNDEFDEAILLDYEGNVAEGPGENLFLVKDGALYTPPAANILPGITRDTVTRIARDLGIEVQEKTITPQELFDADELFFTGTAAEVTGIGTLEGKNIGNGEEGKITRTIKTKYMDMVTGKAEEYKDWLTMVK